MLIACARLLLKSSASIQRTEGMSCMMHIMAADIWMCAPDTIERLAEEEGAWSVRLVCLSRILEVSFHRELSSELMLCLAQPCASPETNSKSNPANSRVTLQI
jgi:hypothetical protein